MRPQIKRIGGLSIKVAVKQDGRFSGGVQPFPIHYRVSPSGKDADPFNTGSSQPVGYPSRSALHISGVLRPGRDAGNTEKVQHLIQELGLVLLEIGFPSVRHDFRFSQGQRDGPDSVNRVGGRIG